MDTLIALDKELFLVLNALHTELLDTLMLSISNKYTWIPFYLYLIITIVRDCKLRSLPVILTMVLLILAADQVTSGIMKPCFARLRPCHDSSISALSHVVGNCGGKFGFASGHAANSFAIATFTYLIFRSKNWFWVFIWAAVISYSRIYLGVHYPFDIIAGGMIGVLFGFLFYKSYYKIFNPL